MIDSMLYILLYSTESIFLWAKIKFPDREKNTSMNEIKIIQFIRS